MGNVDNLTFSSTSAKANIENDKKMPNARVKTKNSSMIFKLICHFTEDARIMFIESILVDKILHILKTPLTIDAKRRK